MSFIKNKVRGKHVEDLESGVLSYLKAKMESMQIRLPGRPLRKDGSPLDPRLPRDLTALSDEQLGQRYTEFCRMAQYAQLHLAYHGVHRSIAKQKERFARAESRLLQSGPVADRSARVEVDDNVHKAVTEHMARESVERLTQAMLDSYLIGKDACSRELTRRQSLPINAELSR